MNFITSLFSTDWQKRLLKLVPATQGSNRSEESKWQERAVESLVKKLKSQSDTLAILEKVLEKQSADTPCVTIQKTQKGRIQINQKKIYPHVAYCRLWRWSNLNNHNELKAVGEHCSKSFYYPKLDEVCINPFHYERVQASLCAASSPQFASSPNSNQNSNQNSISNESFTSSYNGQLSMDLSINDQSLSDQLSYHSLPSNDHQFAYDSNDHHTFDCSPSNDPNYSSNYTPNYNCYQAESPSLMQANSPDAFSCSSYEYDYSQASDCPSNTCDGSLMGKF